MRGEEVHPKKSNHFTASTLNHERRIIEDVDRIKRFGACLASLPHAPPSHPPLPAGFTIVRVENKFTANIDTLDSCPPCTAAQHSMPALNVRVVVTGCRYRAVHYIMQLERQALGGEGSGASHLTFELQLKTFPSMISSDLYHNVVYKSLLPQTSASMADTIRRYAWENVYDELKGFYTSQLNVEHVAAKQATDNTSLIQQLLSSTTYSGNLKLHLVDVNSVYDLLLATTTTTTVVSDNIVRFLQCFHNDRRQHMQLALLRAADCPNAVPPLLSAAHDTYFALDIRPQVANAKSIVLGASLSESAARLLPECGKLRYALRYEALGQPGVACSLTAADLGLHLLSREQLEEFFTQCGKDVTCYAVKGLIELLTSQQPQQEEERGSSPFVMSIYHAPYSELVRAEHGISDPSAKKAFVSCFFHNQLHGLTTAALLMEIGGQDADQRPRNLNKSVDTFAGKPHTMRDVLTWLFWTCANMSAMPSLPRSYRDFIERREELLSMSNPLLRGVPIDRSFTRAIAGQEIKSIEKQLRGDLGRQQTETLSPITAARLLKAHADVVSKYLGVCVDDQDLAHRLSLFIEAETHATCLRLVSDAEDVAEALCADVQRGRCSGLLAALTANCPTWLACGGAAEEQEHEQEQGHEQEAIGRLYMRTSVDSE